MRIRVSPCKSVSSPASRPPKKLDKSTTRPIGCKRKILEAEQREQEKRRGRETHLHHHYLRLWTKNENSRAERRKSFQVRQVRRSRPGPTSRPARPHPPVPAPDLPKTPPADAAKMMEPVGQLLVKEGLITEAQLNETLDLQEKGGGKLFQLLLAMGFIEKGAAPRIPFPSARHRRYRPRTLRHRPRTYGAHPQRTRPRRPRPSRSTASENC